MRSWFWRPGFEMLPAEVIAEAYRECMDRNANLMLNLSPDTTGQLPEQSVATLQQVAGMIRNYRRL
jgi:alpha-L-fucosidase